MLHDLFTKQLLKLRIVFHQLPKVLESIYVMSQQCGFEYLHIAKIMVEARSIQTDYIGQLLHVERQRTYFAK